MNCDECDREMELYLTHNGIEIWKCDACEGEDWIDMCNVPCYDEVEVVVMMAAK